ncbi:hypothetical protein DL768_008320 [Monosporascus sp. mg162]|nr:hypothetical protein DL768_008320 [Monosporascus sp. mg162]
MAVVTCERWAVLIGINQYSDTTARKNLQGCVADVEKTNTILRTYLNVPADHITVLTSPDRLDECIGSNTYPTKANVVDALRKVAKRSNPGDFVYIHYSGHGDRRPTQYAELKKGPKHDEVLCTLEDDLSDVEFGGLLDHLVSRGLAVCVVLDCCHSGGASRLGLGASIRCRRAAEEAANGGQYDGARTRDLRNAVPIQSWFYRPRGYNLIAACQPHETAVEWGGADGKIYGALTYHLIETFLSLQSSTEPITYGRLYEVLEAKCRSKLKQQPMHLGDRSRVIFGSATSLSERGDFLASVIRTSGADVTLNKGVANGISIGDKLRIYHPSQSFLGLLNPKATATTEVIVTSAGKLQCEARSVTGSADDLQGVLVGWLAQLSSRANTAIVNFLLHHEERDSSAYVAVERLQLECQLYASPYMPLDIRLNALDPEADITVEFYENDILKFRDRHGNDLPHVPAEHLSGSLNARQMTSLLQHLCSYQLALSIKNPKTFSIPRYTFEILPDQVEDGDTDSLAAWRVQFKNLHNQFLYITIFNLAPAYGIYQIYPEDHASSAAVDPGEDIPYLVIDMKVPPLLKEASTQPGFKMRDIIKVFITTVQANFSHYCMPDLQGWTESDTGALTKVIQKRHAKLVKPQTEPWFVDEKEIITSVDLEGS